MSLPTCYACNQLATSREHTPPRSFFPEDRRKNLITVPPAEPTIMETPRMWSTSKTPLRS